MHRLRRKNECSLGLPVAAEVLESRALLSAGAAAVHAATQHAAALHPATHHVTQAKIPSFQGTVLAGETLAGGTPLFRGATLSVTSFSPQAGATVSAHFKHFFKSGNAQASITGTFKGKITNVIPLAGNGVEYDVQPIGSVTFLAMGQKFTATPDGTPLRLRYSAGIFVKLSVNVDIPTPGGSVNAEFDLTID